jgi:hypothetical protein
MILVVGGSFFVKWHSMPVDPTTIAGAMYYVCDSWLVTEAEGTSTLNRADRDYHINCQGNQYEFGEMTGLSGTRRVGVNTVDRKLDGMGSRTSFPI